MNRLFLLPIAACAFSGAIYAQGVLIRNAVPYHHEALRFDSGGEATSAVLLLPAERDSALKVQLWLGEGSEIHDLAPLATAFGINEPVTRVGVTFNNGGCQIAAANFLPHPTGVSRYEFESVRCEASNALANFVVQRGNHEESVPVALDTVVVEGKTRWARNSSVVFDLVLGRGDKRVTYRNGYGRNLVYFQAPDASERPLP